VATATEETTEIIEQPVQPLSVVDQLEVFVKETDEAIATMADDFAGLEVTDVDDTAVVAKVTEAHKRVKAVRVKVEKTRKALKEDALKWGQLVDKQARRLKEAIAPIEGRLKAERDKVDAEKARRKAQRDAERAARLQDRVDKLTAVGGDTTGDGTSLAVLGSMADSDFEALLKHQTESYAEQQRVEKIRAVAEEVAGKLTEYGRNVTAEELLDVPHDDQWEMVKAAREAFEERQAEEQKAREEQEAREQKEREKLEAKLKAQQDELDRLKAQEEAREEEERKRLEAEEAQRREEEERKLEQERERQAAEEEAALKAQEEALKPIREQLAAFAVVVESMDIPNTLIDDAIDYAADIQRILNDAAEQIRTLV